MESRTHYEAFKDGENSVGLRAVDRSGEVTNVIRDLGDNFRRLENLAELYNENQLMPENFAQITEDLVGILI